MSHGCAMGWISPFIPYLRSPETHLLSGPLTSDDLSWIGSLLSIGGMVGSILFGSITGKMGKKNAMFLLVIPHLCFWALVYFGTQAYHLYIARFLAGITGGGALRTLTLYVAEMSENRIRGALSALLFLSLAAGILLVFILGAYLDYFLVPLVVLVLPVAYFLSLFFLPDTPVSLLARSKPNEAFESLKFYRTCGAKEIANQSVLEEFETMKAASKLKHESHLEVRDFCR